LIQRIEHEDLVLGFRAANRSIQTKFLKNMSKRKMEVLLNDIEQLPLASKQDTNSSINRIERLVDSLRTSGQVVSMAG
jgi:flagellar motor switch protein FliG